MQFKLGPIFEVILYARDMQGMAEFYRDKLGLAIAWPFDKQDLSQEHWISFDAGGFTLALHSGGQGASGTPPRYGFKVEDIHAAHSELTRRGVPCGEVRSPAPGVQVCDCTDPEGNGFFIESHE